jgi:hypothetical protein
VVVSANNVTAYVCDGTETQFARTFEWFNGALEGNAFELTSKMGAHLTGTLGADGVEGSFVTADGVSMAYRAAEVEADAGLFDSTIFSSGTKYVAAWIVLPDGQQRGAVGGDPTGGGGTLAIMPVPVPRLPASMRVTTEFGTFAVRRIGGG